MHRSLHIYTLRPEDNQPNIENVLSTLVAVGVYKDSPVLIMIIDLDKYMTTVTRHVLLHIQEAGTEMVHQQMPDPTQ